MNKIVIIIIAAVLVVGAGGFYFYDRAQSTAPISEQTADNQEPQGLKVVEDNSIMGWLKRGQQVDCKIYSEAGDIIVLAKDNYVRIDGIPYGFSDGSETGDEPGMYLTDGEWAYMWQGDKGVKFNLKDLESGMSEEQQAEVKSFDWQDMASGWQEAGENYNCSEAKLGDSLFTVPSDVEFQDMSSLFSGLQQIGQQFESQSETGAVPNMEDIEAALQELDLDGLKNGAGVDME